MAAADVKSKHGFTSVEDIDDAPRAAYRDAAGRRYQVRSDLTIDFASVEDYKAGRSRSMGAHGGSGVLDVLVCTTEAGDGTGVLLVDGEPVAAGMRLSAMSSRRL
jgi:hypothetical protein